MTRQTAAVSFSEDRRGGGPSATTFRSAALVAMALLALSGCAGAPTPMAQLLRPPKDAPRCILVLLPGIGDRAEAWERQGFLGLVERRRLPVIAVAADATLGYYQRGTMTERVTADVVEPLRRQHPGAELWVSGMSMGGFGSLFYAMENPGRVSGVLAMAPFLGDGPPREVRAAGGLRAWHAPAAAPATQANYQQQLWRWLQESTAPGAKAPSLYVGYGTRDSLAPDVAVLAEALPAGHVWLTEGGHDWPWWQPIFEQFLDSPEFRAHCGPAADSVALAPGR